MPQDQQNKPRIRYDAIIGTLLLGTAVLGYLRPPDPAHPTRFDFLSKTVCLPFWLVVISAVGISAITAFVIHLKQRLRNTSAQKPRQEDLSTARPIESIQPPAPAGIRVNATAKVATQHPGRSLIVVSPEYFAIEIEEQEHQDTNGLIFKIRNDRLEGISGIKLTIYKAQSFDSRHGQFREPQATAILVIQPDRIAPSSYGKLSWLIAKKRPKRYLFAGDSASHDLAWPENDKSEIQRWRLTIAVDAQTTVPGEDLSPLAQLKFTADVDWSTTTNQFSIRQV
jgi:hypothetical protein